MFWKLDTKETVNDVEYHLDSGREALRRLQEELLPMVDRRRGIERPTDRFNRSRGAVDPWQVSKASSAGWSARIDEKSIKNGRQGSARTVSTPRVVEDRLVAKTIGTILIQKIPENRIKGFTFAPPIGAAETRLQTGSPANVTHRAPRAVTSPTSSESPQRGSALSSPTSSAAPGALSSPGLQHDRSSPDRTDLHVHRISPEQKQLSPPAFSAPHIPDPRMIPARNGAFASTISSNVRIPTATTASQQRRRGSASTMRKFSASGAAGWTSVEMGGWGLVEEAAPPSPRRPRDVGSIVFADEARSRRYLPISRPVKPQGDVSPRALDISNVARARAEASLAARAMVNGRGVSTKQGNNNKRPVTADAAGQVPQGNITAPPAKPVRPQTTEKPEQSPLVPTSKPPLEASPPPTAAKSGVRNAKTEAPELNCGNLLRVSQAALRGDAASGGIQGLAVRSSPQKSGGISPTSGGAQDVVRPSPREKPSSSADFVLTPSRVTSSHE